MMDRSRLTGFCRGNRKQTIIAVLIFIVIGCASPLLATGAQASGIPEAGAHDITESRQTSEATSSQDVSGSMAIFSDDFEAFGDSSLWNRGELFPVQSEYVANGTHAARLNNQGGNPVYGRKSLNGDYDKLFVRIRFQVLELGPHPSTLVNLRATPTSTVLELRIDADGSISYVAGATGSVSESKITSAANTWHELQVYLDTSTDTGTVRLWLDQTELTSMRQDVWMGSSVVRMVDLGDNSAGQQSDVAFDDIIVDDEFIPSNRPADPVPGILTIHTFPAWENIGFELDGETFYSDADGMVTVQVSRWSTDLRSRISVTPSSRSDGSQASFTGWRNWFSAQSRDVYAAFQISKLVTFSFVDMQGNPVDPAIVDSVTIKSNSGVLQTLSNQNLSQPALINTSSVVPQPTGIENKTTQYVVDEVLIDGANVVHQAQQRSNFDRSLHWEISLLFYSVTFIARDAFLGTPLGTEIVVESKDGSEQRYPIDEQGEATIPRLPRGEYTVAVLGAGYAPPRPILVSRDQKIEMEVISRLDMAIFALTIATIVVGLVLCGRPFLLTRPIRYVWSLLPVPLTVRQRGGHQ